MVRAFKNSVEICVLTTNPFWVLFSAIMTVSEIIEALGGVRAISAELKIPLTTVGNWRDRRSIPARYHHALIRMGDGKVSAEQIAFAHAEAPAV